MISHLKDVINFQYGTSKKRKWWISGCSFAANVAVWTTLKFPYLFEATLADSAPVLGVLEFWEMDDWIARKFDEK